MNRAERQLLRESNEAATGIAWRVKSVITEREEAKREGQAAHNELISRMQRLSHNGESLGLLPLGIPGDAARFVELATLADLPEVDPAFESWLNDTPESVARAVTDVQPVLRLTRVFLDDDGRRRAEGAKNWLQGLVEQFQDAFP